jgi:hypothetical protein
MNKLENATPGWDIQRPSWLALLRSVRQRRPPAQKPPVLEWIPSTPSDFEPLAAVCFAMKQNTWLLETKRLDSLGIKNTTHYSIIVGMGCGFQESQGNIRGETKKSTRI